MAGSCDELYFFEVVAFALCVVTIVFFNEISHFLLVVLADELSDNFLSDIATNIFIIVTFASHFLLPHFFENV